MPDARLALHRQEMDIVGATLLDPLLAAAEVEFFRTDLLRRSDEDVAHYGRDKLIEGGFYETVIDLARFGGKYLDLLAHPALNAFVDYVLNDKAIIWSYNGIINQPDARSKMVGFGFHRDQPWFKDTRTAVVVMIPLVDFSEETGATEYVPSTHLFREMPASDFMESHRVVAAAPAGTAIAVDATTWHRAGVNRSGAPRPMLTLKYVLGPFKQQVDYCATAAEHLEDAPAIVRQRLGWNVRQNRDQEDLRLPPEEKRFRSGQYDMTNTSQHEYDAWRSDEDE